MRMKYLAVPLVLILLMLPLGGCRGKGADVEVLLDGAKYAGGATGEGDLRVYITLDGKALIDLPFDEAHTVAVTQSDGSENVIRLTGDRVIMERANCENKDCVNMGEVTRDNLEMRVMGGFIICLPHKVSVEVR